MTRSSSAPELELMLDCIDSTTSFNTEVGQWQLVGKLRDANGTALATCETIETLTSAQPINFGCVFLVP